MISYCHHTVVCPSVCDTVQCGYKHPTAKVSLSKQVNRKCPLGLQLLTCILTLYSETPHLLNHGICSDCV